MSGQTSRPLDGKLAIVTGASRGIGAAIAANLASKGCSLIMNYTSSSSESKATSLASSLSSQHSITALACRADMGSPTGPADIVAFAREHFAHPKSGNLTVHILINNAGVAGDRMVKGANPEDFVKDFERMYKINVLGPLLLVNALEPYLPTDRTGRIVNIASVSSSSGFPGQSIYGGTKAALESMTRSWSRELSERCTVNAVNPGPVATDMYGGVSDDFADHMRAWNTITPRAQVVEGKDDQETYKEVTEGKGLGGRAARADEIAGIVGMLCGQESAWCTGSVVNANGGMLMQR